MPAESVIAVEGLRQLNKAFARADKKLKKDLHDSLKDAAEPVRADAEHLAVAEIRNIGQAWSLMRVGVTQSSVYVAPKQRGARGRGGKRRPNLAPLLMDRAMVPALGKNQPKVIEKIEALLDTVGREWER